MSTPTPVPAAPAAPAPQPASVVIPAAAAPIAPALSPAPVSPAAPAVGDWTQGLSDDTKGWISNKQFQNPGQLADAYRNLEKLRGVPAERLLQLPEDMNTPEGRAIFERLGAPKTAAEYGLDKLMPKEGGDPKLAEWASEVFLEAGIPRNAAEKIISKWNERGAASQNADKENYSAMLTQGEAALKKEWGAAYDQNVNLAKSGMRALELDGKEVDTLERIMGRERLFKKLSKIGAGVGESGFVAGRPAADGALAPEQARAKIKELQGDPTWTRRYLKGESDAKSQMTKLQQMAYPGEFTI